MRIIINGSLRSVAPRRKKRLSCLSSGLLIMLIMTLSHAANAGYIQFDVTVIAPSCTVNNNKPIDVDFGSDIKISHIGKGDYKRVPVRFTLFCPAAGNYSLVINGVGASFEPAALATDISNLGVEFMIDHTRVAVNEKVSFKYPDIPTLYARPVINPVNQPVAGTFSATASMQVSYD